MKKIILVSILGMAGGLWLGCHGKNNVSVGELQLSNAGIPRPAGSDINLIPSPSPSPAPFPSPSPPPPPAPGECPSDGSYKIINPYLATGDRAVGVLIPSNAPKIGELTDRSGGRISDFLIYQKNSSAYLILNYGSVVTVRDYKPDIASDAVPLKKNDLSFPVEKMVLGSDGTNDMLVVGTTFGVHFLTPETLDEVFKIPFPKKVVDLFFDETSKDLYVATAGNNVYRIRQTALHGGCVEQVVRSADFVDRVIKKIQVSKDSKLVILTEPVSPPRRFFANVTDNSREVFVALLNVNVAFRSVAEQKSPRVDIVDLRDGSKKSVVLEFNWPGDFFLFQDKLYLVVNHVLKEEQLDTLKNNILLFLQDTCRSSSRCPAVDEILGYLIMNNMLRDVPLPQEMQSLQSFVDYFHAPPALVSFSDLNNVASPSEIYPIEDPLGNNFKTPFFEVKGLSKANRIFLSGSFGIVGVKPTSSGFRQETLYQYQDTEMRLALLFQPLKLDFFEDGSKQSILNLMGSSFSRVLEDVDLSDPTKITVFKSWGLPNVLFGKKGDSTLTHFDWSDLLENKEEVARWKTGEDHGNNLVPAGWGYEQNNFSWDAVSGSVVFLKLNGNKFEAKLFSTASGNPLPLNNYQFFDYVSKENVTEPNGSVCEKTITRQLKGVRHVGFADRNGATFFLLFVEADAVACPGRPDASSTNLVLRSFDYNGTTLSPSSDSTLSRGLGPYDKTKFIGWGHRASDATAVLVTVPTRGVNEAVFLVKRFEADKAIAKKVLIASNNYPNIIFAEGGGDSFVVAKKINSTPSQVKFYTYPWSTLPLSSPLRFLSSEEISYGLRASPLPGELDKILTMDATHWVLKFFHPQLGYQLEYMKLDGGQLKHISGGAAPDLLDLGYAVDEPLSLILTTSNNGLEFYTLPAP